MESINMNDLPCTAMSPGLDGWRQEQRSMSIMSRVESMNLCRSTSFDPYLNKEVRDGQRQEVAVKNDNLRRSDAADGVDQIMPKASEKAIRSFKFALAEYFKEALKPYYTEGKVSRAVHKIIIKKSVSKVIDSCGTCGIPDNDQAIDSYLRSSHLKICKLMQAYVEKYQKTSS